MPGKHSSPGSCKKLGLAYLDTGAMYRAVTLEALRKKANLYDNKVLESLTAGLVIDIKSAEDGQNIIYLNGEDVTAAIRLPEVSRHVSIVARCAEVREILVQKQKEIGRRGNIVMDGRDIGTNVMPDAEYKIFLTASLEERARRRMFELREKGEHIELEQMIKEIEARDKIDTERECSPLRQADDAILVDTTNMTIAEVVDKIVDIVAGRKD